MNLLTEVQSKISEIEDDNRYKREPIFVQNNAPLALVQVEMRAKMIVLKWVESYLKGEKEKTKIPQGSISA